MVPKGLRTQRDRPHSRVASLRIGYAGMTTEHIRAALDGKRDPSDHRDGHDVPDLEALIRRKQEALQLPPGYFVRALPPDSARWFWVGSMAACGIGLISGVLLTMLWYAVR